MPCPQIVGACVSTDAIGEAVGYVAAAIRLARSSYGLATDLIGSFMEDLSRARELVNRAEGGCGSPRPPFEDAVGMLTRAVDLLQDRATLGAADNFEYRSAQASILAKLKNTPCALGDVCRHVKASAYFARAPHMSWNSAALRAFDV